MCVACLTFSALALFTPVSEAPQATEIQQNGVRELVFTQSEPLPLAQETQLAIADFLDYLPDDPDLALFRDGLQALSVELDTVTSDDAAQQLVRDRLRDLEAQVLASPNRDRIIAVLRDLVVGDNPLQVSLLTHFQGIG